MAHAPLGTLNKLHRSYLKRWLFYQQTFQTAAEVSAGEIY